MDLRENFTTDGEKEELVKFWKASTSASRSKNVKGFFNIAR